MKGSVSIHAGLVLALLLAIPAPDGAQALPVPPLKGYVNDYAELLSPAQKASLESLLKRFEARTSNQVVVLIVPSLEGDSLEDFSIRVADKWKVGQKGRDNGVIFLVALKERKARIEVGYGLEGALTDAESGRILRELVFPAFRQGDYFGGIQAGLVGILAQTQAEFTAQPGRQGPAPAATHSKKKASGLLVFLLFFLLMFSRFGRFLFWGGLLGTGMWGGRGVGGFGGGGLGGFGGGGGGFGGGGASGGW